MGTDKVALLEAWDEHRRKISLADFVVIAAEAVMNRLSHKQLFDASTFEWGRITKLSCDGPLPMASAGCKANEETFINSLNLTWRETTALMGVHTLGRARNRHSGFEGWWSDPANSRIFNNNYYLSLALKGWAPSRNFSNELQWSRVGSNAKEFGKMHEMMLPTDLCLLFGSVSELPESEPCCAWIAPKAFEKSSVEVPTITGDPAQDKAAQAILNLQAQRGTGPEYCGFDVHEDEKELTGRWMGNNKPLRHWCCEDHEQFGFETDQTVMHLPDCAPIDDIMSGVFPQGAGVDGDNSAKAVLDFAIDEEEWMKTFVVAWRKATVPRNRDDPCSVGEAILIGFNIILFAKMRLVDSFCGGFQRPGIAIPRKSLRSPILRRIQPQQISR